MHGCDYQKDNDDCEKYQNWVFSSHGVTKSGCGRNFLVLAGFDIELENNKHEDKYK